MSIESDFHRGQQHLLVNYKYLPFLCPKNLHMYHKPHRDFTILWSDTTFKAEVRYLV